MHQVNIFRIIFTKAPFFLKYVLHIYIYIYIYTHTHTHTYIFSIMLVGFDYKSVVQSVLFICT